MFSASRIVRVTRGLLILLSALAIFGTIAFIQKLETPKSFSFGVHSAKRVLQQLYAANSCKNCSNLENASIELADQDANIGMNTAKMKLDDVSSSPNSKMSSANDDDMSIAVAAAEIISPEEAIPEEMVPDQEAPSVLSDISTKIEQQHEPSEDTQQKDSLLVNEKPLKASGVLSAVQSDDVARTNKLSKIDPLVRSNLRMVKIQSSQIESMKESVPYHKPEIQSKAKEIENPPVITRNLYQFGHILPPKDVCPERGEGMKLMILVTTAPSHVTQRFAVRSTWGHVALRRDTGLAFMVGMSKDPKENKLIAQENTIYGDIIQGMFLDTYNNLTLKTISMLEWSSEHCDRVHYLLKTDDDMYIHIPMLFSILDGASSRRRAIIGKVAKRWKPIRNVTSKYFISQEQFKPAFYPDFNTGPAYVLTNDIIEPLYRASLLGTFFKLEDVYVTGMMAAPLKITHIDYPQFYNRRLKLDTCAVAKLVSVHMVKGYEMFDLWKRLGDGLTRCS